MKFDVAKDMARMETHVRLRVSDFDVLKQIDPRAVVALVIKGIADKVAESLADKIGPAVEKALAADLTEIAR